MKYFTTPQTANLRLDLQRQLTSKQAVSVIHGVKGSGKTCFIEDFIQRFCLRDKAWIIRVVSTEKYLDCNHKEQSVVLLLQTLSAKKLPDLLFLDQLELAGSETRQALLDKFKNIHQQVKLVMLMRSDYFNASIKLFQSSGIQFNVFELKPMSFMEQQSFIEKSLCVADCVDFNREARLVKQIKETHGNFNAMLELLDRFRGSVQCVPCKISGLWFSKSAILGIVLFVLMIVLAGWGWNGWRDENSFDHDDRAASEQKLSKIKTSQEQPSISATIKPTSMDSISSSETAPVIPEENQLTTKPAEDSNQQVVTRDRVVDDEAESLSVFDQGQQWLVNSSEDAFTLQLLSVADEQDRGALYRQILDELVKQNLKSSDIHFLIHHQASGSYLSVLYGSYTEYSEAQKTKQSLSPLLQKNKPVIRRIKTLR